MTHLTDDTIRALMNAATEGPYDCHLGSDGVCQCASIVGMHGGMGALAIVCVDNGLPISEGGNDAPDLEQAKANARLLTAAPDLAAECLSRGAERDAALARVKELEGAILMVADQALVSEIPEGYGPEPSPEFDRGYDAAIQNARKALEAGNE